MDRPATRPERRVVMRDILHLCRTTPRSNAELARLTGSSLGSVQVLTHRLRKYGELVTLNPGTAGAVHLTNGGAE